MTADRSGIERRQKPREPEKFDGPKSNCVCGHTGDGPQSQHEERFGQGHGHCRLCRCEGFTWGGYTEAYREWRIKERHPVGAQAPLPETAARLARRRGR